MPALFGEGNYQRDTHPKKAYIVKYTVGKSALQVTESKVQRCVAQIRQHAWNQIAQLKQMTPQKDLVKYQAGIKMAFQLHQYANAALILEKS